MAVAVSLWLRDSVSSDVKGIPQTFSSWNNCMTKAYCKCVVISPVYHDSYVLTRIPQMASYHRDHRGFGGRPLYCLVPCPLPVLWRGMLLWLPIMLSFLLRIWWSKAETTKICGPAFFAFQPGTLPRLSTYPSATNV